MDLVESDRLFVSTQSGDETTPAKTLPPVVSSSASPSKHVEAHAQMPGTCESSDEMDVVDTVDEFRDKVSRAVRDHMDDSSFSNESMQSWSSNCTSGCELVFVYRTKSRSVKRTYLSVVITAFSSPNMSAVNNVFRISDGCRHLLSSFVVLPASVALSVTDGLGRAVAQSGVGHVSLTQLIQISVIKDAMLPFLLPNEVAHLSCINKLVHRCLVSKDVDVTYWKKCYLRDFNDTIRAEAKGSTYRQKYADCARKRKEQANQLQNRIRNRPSLGEVLNPPYRDPLREPDPLRDPRFGIPPPWNPFAPGPPRVGPGNPYDPMYGEVLPDRPPRFQGPRQMGGFPPEDFI